MKKPNLKFSIQLGSYVLMLLLTTLLIPLRAQTVSAAKSNQDEVQQTITQALQDLEAGDFTRYRTHLTPGFYMFDGGKRFSADVLLRSCNACGLPGCGTAGVSLSRTSTLTEGRLGLPM